MFRVLRGLLFIAHAFIHEMIHVFAFFVTGESFTAVVIGRKSDERDVGLSVVWPWEEGFRYRGRVLQHEDGTSAISLLFILALPFAVEMLFTAKLSLTFFQLWGFPAGLVSWALLFNYFVRSSEKDGENFFKAIWLIGEELFRE